MNEENVYDTQETESGMDGSAVLDAVPVSEDVSETIPADGPDAVTDDTETLLDADTSAVSTASGDLEQSPDSTESGIDEADVLADTSIDICTYTVEEQEADALIIGGLDKLNETCTLILFYLLFAWADRKIQAILNGVSGK